MSLVPTRAGPPRTLDGSLIGTVAIKLVCRASISICPKSNFSPRLPFRVPNMGIRTISGLYRNEPAIVFCLLWLKLSRCLVRAAHMWGGRGDTRTPIGGLHICHIGNPSLTEIAEMAGVSMRSFQRKLSYAGITYSDLLDTVRFENASKLLRDTDRKIIEVAFSSGYTDPAHFTRAFRRMTGVTPRQFREQRGPG